MLNTARLFASLTCALFVLGSSPSSFGQSSGGSTLLWEHCARTAPFIPGDLTLGLHDNHVWSCASFGSRRVMLFDSVDGANVPRGLDVLPDTSVGTVGVAAAKRGSALFSVSQQMTSNGRRFGFARYDAADNALQAPFSAIWSATASLPGTLSARICTDAEGAALIAATWNGTHIGLAIYDGETGTLQNLTSLPSSNLLALEVSDTGDRIALLAGADLVIYDDQLGIVHQEAFSTPPSSFSFAGNGRRFAVGFAGRVEVFGEQAFWSQQQLIASSSSWIANKLDLNFDGTSAAIGWWNVSTSVGVRFELRDGPMLSTVASHEQLGNPLGLQNIPEDVVITPDGQRAAFGCWGAQDSNPEVVLLDRNQSGPVLEIDLPGSVRSLDIDKLGQRVAVSFKETHANVIGSLGCVRLYDTGEKDLWLRAVPQVSTGLEFRYDPPSVPNAAFLAFGRRAAAPTPLSAGSMLALDRLSIRIVPSGSGQFQSEGSLPLAPFPHLRGREFAVQMVYRTPRGLRSSASVLDFLLL